MSLLELPVAVTEGNWEKVLSGDNLAAIEAYLPAFLAGQRWFAGKGEPLTGARLMQVGDLTDGGESRFALATIETDSGSGHRLYFLPLAIVLPADSRDPAGAGRVGTLASVRIAGTIGIVADAVTVPGFVRALVDRMARGTTLPIREGGALTLNSTAAMSAMPRAADATIRPLAKEQSNTSIRIGEAMIFKVYRRLQPGVHPEVEIGRHLTEAAGFTHAPRLFGWMQLEDGQGVPTALGVLQEFVASEGDAWTVTLAFVRSMLGTLDDRRAAADGSYLSLAATLGRRVGELHLAFALPSEDDGFRPAPVTSDDLARWRRRAAEQAAVARRALATVSSGLAERVRQRWSAVEHQLQTLLPADLDTIRIRHHGDLHLGQVLVTGDDVSILDFEGEPLRPLAERREKHCPLRDVAGMVRSFAYAREAVARDQSAAGMMADPRTLAALAAWEARAVEAFIGGYRAATAGCRAVPASDEAFSRVLAFFVLEKALYEVCYERENRPDWLDLPVSSLERLIGG